MLEVNEYFDGKVKSIKMETSQGSATVGVMAKGEYEFSTTSEETMVVTEGRLKVKFPGKEKYKTIVKGKTFKVYENVTFQVIAEVESSYICYYK